MASARMATGENTSLAQRKRCAGQRMVIGFEGQAVSNELRNLCQEIQPAGFVLFGRNVFDPLQVKDLTSELTALCHKDHTPFIAVDQEGGRVQRVKTPATVWPPMGAAGCHPDRIPELSRAMASELLAMGFNLNFSPVADDRSFGTNPSDVAKAVTAFIHGHQSEGLVACAKHFPGHGDTQLDSHLALPYVKRSEQSLRETELIPFRAAIQANVGSVMSAHVVYTAFDDTHPATLSHLIIPKILREELAYDGVVFSDDLEMKAIRDHYSVKETVTRATHGTVDILLCCRDGDRQMEFYRELVVAQEHDEKFEALSHQSLQRILSLQHRFFSAKRPEKDVAVIGCQAHLELAERLIHSS
jgi:beta-N-acetylhexosaminidase